MIHTCVPYFPTLTPAACPVSLRSMQRGCWAGGDDEDAPFGTLGGALSSILTMPSQVSLGFGVLIY